MIGLVFIIPVVAAIFWKPQQFMNHGELVEPARPIDDVALTTLEGKPIRFGELKTKWTLLYFGPAACLQACERNLYKMRQVRLAQGKNMLRVQNVFVMTDPGGLQRLREVLKQYPDLRVVTGTRKNVKALVDQFALQPGSPSSRLRRIYVVDPIGNFMMSYPADADPSGMRKDLARLLKVSRIG